MTENEAVELAKTIDDELEAHVINDEITAHVINDEVDAHILNDEIEAYKINETMGMSQEEKDNLLQVAETFDAMDAAGEGVDAPNPKFEAMQNMMAKYMAAQSGHQPGKEFKYSDVTYVVQAYPHAGMWTRKEKRVATNPNMKNNSVRRKLAKNPSKYTISTF